MKILFIAPLPPPVHGSAMVSQYIKDSQLVNEQHDCDFVNLSTSRRMDEIGKGGVKKILRFVGAYLTLLWKLLTRRYDLCYLAITCHGVGFLKDAPFVLLCKLFRRRVMIHQHNKGMSRYVERWPYRWLLPLVYRNTRVMLLSWHLYDDIAAVVKREQVVVCANGVPPLQVIGEGLKVKGQEPKANSQAPDTTQENSHADFTDYTESISCQRASAASEDINQQNLDTITQNTPCFARVGHPDGNAKHYTLDTQQKLSHADSTDYTESISCQRAGAASEDVNQRDLNEITQNLQVASPLLASGAHTHMEGNTKLSTLNAKQELSHTDFTDYTENASLAGNINLTQTSQNSRNNISEQDNQRELDTITQNTHCFARVGHPDGDTKHYTLNSKHNTIGVVSRLERIKGIDLVVPAFAEVLKDYPETQLLVVGDGTLRASMEEQAAQLGCVDHIRFVGRQPQEELPQWYSQMDIVLMPSRSEGFGLTAIEAMAHGCVMVASDVGGLPEVVRDGICGLLHRTEDVADMAAKVCTLIGDEALYAQLRAQSLVEVGKYSFERYAALMNNLYNKLGR